MLVTRSFVYTSSQTGNDGVHLFQCCNYIVGISFLAFVPEAGSVALYCFQIREMGFYLFPSFRLAIFFLFACLFVYSGWVVRCQNANS